MVLVVLQYFHKVVATIVMGTEVIILLIHLLVEILEEKVVVKVGFVFVVEVFVDVVVVVMYC